MSFTEKTRVGHIFIKGDIMGQLKNFYHLISLNSYMLTTKTSEEDEEKMELSDTAGRNVKWCGHCEKQFDCSSIS